MNIFTPNYVFVKRLVFVKLMFVLAYENKKNNCEYDKSLFGDFWNFLGERLKMDSVIDRKSEILHAISFSKNVYLRSKFATRKDFKKFDPNLFFSQRNKVYHAKKTA